MAAHPPHHVRRPSPLASTVPPPVDDSIVIGDYSIINELGSGSFATVYRAKRLKDNEIVAIKCISVDRLDEANKKALAAEVKTLQQIHHPNIVKFIDMFRSPKYFFIVLENCVGGDVRQYVRSHGLLAENQAQRVLRQLAAALKHLWQMHMIHRDIKPGNLLLTSNNIDTATVKLADFGFARHLESTALAETMCGSPLYMAPELLREHKCDAKGDLWSVGVLLVELLTGKTPFTGHNPLHLLNNIEKSVWANAVTRPSITEFTSHPFESTLGGILDPKLAHSLSADCKDLIWRLLRRNPHQRISYEQFFEHPWVSLLEEIDEVDSSFESPISNSMNASGRQASAEAFHARRETSEHSMIMSRALSKGLSLVASLHPISHSPSMNVTAPIKTTELSPSFATRRTGTTASFSHDNTTDNTSPSPVNDDFVIIDEATTTLLDPATRIDKLTMATIHNDLVRTYTSAQEAVCDAVRSCMEAAALFNQAKYATELLTRPSLDIQLRLLTVAGINLSTEEMAASHTDEAALPFAELDSPSKGVSTSLHNESMWGDAPELLTLRDYDRESKDSLERLRNLALDLWERAGLAFRGASALSDLVSRRVTHLPHVSGLPKAPPVSALRDWVSWCDTSQEACNVLADLLRRHQQTPVSLLAIEVENTCKSAGVDL